MSSKYAYVLYYSFPSGKKITFTWVNEITEFVELMN